MKFLGYSRPDGSVGIRNHICLLSADECSDPVCKRVAMSVRGAMAMPYQSIRRNGDLEEEALRNLMAGNAANPNVGALIIIESNSDHSLAQYVASEVAKTGRLVEVINIANCGGVVGASSRALATAVTMVRDITTYRREPVKVSKLNVGFWLEEQNPLNLNQTIARCCEMLLEHDCGIIGNTGLRVALERVVTKDKDQWDFTALMKKLPEFRKPGLKSIVAKSRKQFELLSAASGAQIMVVAVMEGHVPDHPLLPAVRITSSRDYYEKMGDTVELDLSSVADGELDPSHAGLLVLNEILAACSGRLSKCEILDEATF